MLSPFPLFPTVLNPSFQSPEPIFGIPCSPKLIALSIALIQWKYISSFLGFASAEHPTVMALILIDEPEGVYYGGTIAAPAVKELFENKMNAYIFCNNSEAQEG